ncbi:MAG: rubredoxin [Peptostreptococcus sp.]|nr:rubredoxin [Peptostreptococcus sp.]MBF1057251.1 rubredoxin [Peptostreptococcus sp.]
MKKYKCRPCGFVYDPEKGVPAYGIEPGVPFEDLPDDWVCPKCAASRWMFEEVKEDK